MEREMRMNGKYVSRYFILIATYLTAADCYGSRRDGYSAAEVAHPDVL